MGKTTIEWTDQSWPVLNGCRRISPGCENCYAERLTATRLRNTPKYKGLAMYRKNGPRWTGKSRLWVDALQMPLKLRKPSKIFVADMGDLFYEGNSFDDIATVWGVMASCPRHTFQVLTKRPARAIAFFKWLGGAHATCAEPAQTTYCVIKAQDVTGLCSDKLYSRAPWPLQNVWIGVSAENQQTADERIPLLLQIPAAVHFVSAEPLLGPIELRNGSTNRWSVPTRHDAQGRGIEWSDPGQNYIPVDWIIVGGESGPGARACDVAWIRSIVEQCKQASVAVFVKQLGRKPIEHYLGCGPTPPTRIGYGIDEMRFLMKHKKGADMSEWPEDLRVQQYPPLKAA